MGVAPPRDWEWVLAGQAQALLVPLHLVQLHACSARMIRSAGDSLKAGRVKDSAALQVFACQVQALLAPLQHSQDHSCETAAEVGQAAI